MTAVFPLLYPVMGLLKRYGIISRGWDNEMRGRCGHKRRGREGNSSLGHYALSRLNTLLVMIICLHNV